MDLESDFISLDVGPDMTLNDIKAIIQAETNVPPSSQYFLQEGRPVPDTSITLSQMNIQEGDVVAMMIQNARPRRTPAQPNATDPAAQRARGGVDPEQSRLRILGDPVILAELRRQDPELAAATSDRERFHNLWTTRQEQYEQVQRDKEEQIALLEADPFNVEAQQKIEEMIRQARVAENLQKAMEENPECKLHGDAAMVYANSSHSIWKSDHALYRRHCQQCSHQSLCGLGSADHHHVSRGR